MQVAFEREIDFMKGEKGHSHYLWTISKDKMLKYWDGDKVRISCYLVFLLSPDYTQSPQFENIQKLNGHHGEIWALAVSNNGKFVITGSHDKSLRVWEKTDEPVSFEIFSCGTWAVSGLSHRSSTACSCFLKKNEKKSSKLCMRQASLTR